MNCYVPISDIIKPKKVSDFTLQEILNANNIEKPFCEKNLEWNVMENCPVVWMISAGKRRSFWSGGLWIYDSTINKGH